LKVFISWSGDISKKVSQALCEWLPMIFEKITFWMSSRDIKAGKRWAIDLAHNLDKTDFGILCLTTRNISAPWVLFEAGALSKSVESGRVIPYLIGMSPNELPEPLSQFQSVAASKEGTYDLVKAIAEADPLSVRQDRTLDSLFCYLWPLLEKKLNEIISETEQNDRFCKFTLNELINILRLSGITVTKGTNISLSVYNAELSLYLNINGKQIPTHRFPTVERATEISELGDHGISYQFNHWVFEWLDEGLIIKLKEALIK